MSADVNEIFELPAVWVGYDDTPVLAANQFLMQANDGEFILALGHVSPPLLAGPPEAVKESLEKIDYVSIRTIARVTMTLPRIREMRNLLDRVVKDHEPDDTHHDQPE